MPVTLLFALRPYCFLPLVMSSVAIVVRRCRPPLSSVGAVATCVGRRRRRRCLAVVAAWFGCQSPSAAVDCVAVCCPLAVVRCCCCRPSFVVVLATLTLPEDPASPSVVRPRLLLLSIFLACCPSPLFVFAVVHRFRPRCFSPHLLSVPPKVQPHDRAWVGGRACGGYGRGDG